MDIALPLLALSLIFSAGLLGGSIWIKNGGSRLEAVFVTLVSMLTMVALIDAGLTVLENLGVL